jgi:hypothetical protein
MLQMLLQLELCGWARLPDIYFIVCGSKDAQQDNRAKKHTKI